jgi:hypothetical protein
VAEDELTQTGIRVGRWLPAVPAQPDPGSRPPAAPWRPPADTDAGGAPPGVTTPTAGSGPDRPWPGAGRRPDPAGPAHAPPAADSVADRLAHAAPAAAGAGPARAVPADPAPARRSARESVAERLPGPAAARVPATAGAAGNGRATRVRVARTRRRRRGAALAAVAVTALVLAVAYGVREAGRDHEPIVPATLPTAPAAAPAPAPPPTVVPVTANPAFPGGPLLTVDRQPVPATVDLTALGTRDWIHWGGPASGGMQRKQTGTGEIGPAVQEVARAAGDRFYEYVIHFRAPRGARLLISWRALAVAGAGTDGVTMEAVTVS